MFAVNEVKYFLGNVDIKKRWCCLVDVSQFNVSKWIRRREAERIVRKCNQYSFCLLQFLFLERGKCGGGGWGGRLFEATRLSTFPPYRMGAYWKWAQIRGWVLNQINSVSSTKMNVQISSL